MNIFTPFVLIDRGLANITIGIINIYQKTLSPDHGPLRHLNSNGYCRFHPTCSEYGKESLRKKGFILGMPVLLYRILRCNPWSKGGIDPVKN